MLATDKEMYVQECKKLFKELNEYYFKQNIVFDNNYILLTRVCEKLTPKQYKNKSTPLIMVSKVKLNKIFS